VTDLLAAIFVAYNYVLMCVNFVKGPHWASKCMSIVYKLTRSRCKTFIGQN